MYSRCSHLGPLAAKLRPWSRVHGLLVRAGLCANPRVSLSDIPFRDPNHLHFTPPSFFLALPHTSLAKLAPFLT